MAIKLTALDDLPVTHEGYDQFIEQLCENIPQCWDNDVAVESIIIDYLRSIEPAGRCTGAQHKQWC
jgi:hypothetical protein